MTVYKMFASAAGVTTVVSASIDIQNDGIIEAITLGVTSRDDATTSIPYNVVAEVSFGSTNTFSTNDARASLCQAAIHHEATTTTPALGNIGVPFCVIPGLSVKVAAGERIFLHCQASSAALEVANAVAYLFVRDGQDALPERRRR
mgnify:CR=1 FL=1